MAEKEYIERPALRDALYDADAITMKGVAIINQFPAADVREVKRGKWTMGHLPPTGVGTYAVVQCSECSSQFPFWPTNFCPDCGADMRGDDTDSTT